MFLPVNLGSYVKYDSSVMFMYMICEMHSHFRFEESNDFTFLGDPGPGSMGTMSIRSKVSGGIF